MWQAPEPRRGPELYSVPEGEEFSFMNDSFGLNGSFGLDGLARFSDIMPRDSGAYCESVVVQWCVRGDECMCMRSGVVMEMFELPVASVGTLFVVLL